MMHSPKTKEAWLEELRKPEYQLNRRSAEDVLRQPSDFAYFGRLPFGVTWTLGPVIQHRDSGPLTISNARVLRRTLKELEELEVISADDYAVTGASHWAVGWVDHLSYRVFEGDPDPASISRTYEEVLRLDENGEPIPTVVSMFMEWWDAKLRVYPIADEDDAWDAEQEDAELVLENCYGYGLKADKPEDWVQQVLLKLEPGTDYYLVGESTHFDEERLNEVFEELGYKEKESDA